MASIQKRPNGRWRARYRDPDGREHARHFDRRTDAQQWLDTVTAQLVRGDYIDPRGGKVTLREFVDVWLRQQTTGVTTQEAVEQRLRRHVLPHLGNRELRAIKPSTLQAWLRGLQGDLAPNTIKVVFANLSSVLGAAVEDGLIASNPCAARSVRPPRVDQRQVIPWTRERVAAVIDAHPDRWHAVPVVAAACGLRQGETFGIAVEDVDFLRRQLRVRQQVKVAKGRRVLDSPKTKKSRTVPLPDVAAFAISERLRKYPARDGLVFTTREGGMLHSSYYNRHVWKPALRTAGVEPSRENGMHALRHHYASALLSAGVSIRAVAEYLGHADPGYTLRSYAHLMPQDEDRARTAIESALQDPRPADSVRTDAPADQ